MTRVVRDVCIELARASASRAERVALLAIAFFAERDEAIERVAPLPALPLLDEAERDKFLDRAMDRLIQTVVGDSVKPAASKGD